MNAATSSAPVPPRAIFLIGFMGSGKTTVGKLLAERVAWNFVDLDGVIEQEEGLSVAEIFARAGEPAFRRREQELLWRILEETPRADNRIIALGGGTVAQLGNLEMLQRSGAVSIWLDCPVEELLMRCALVLSRPLFRDEASFQRLHEERLPYYRQATYRIEAGRGAPIEVVRRILSLPIFQNQSGRREDDTQRPPSSTTAV